jgi:hypothetical protein
MADMNRPRHPVLHTKLFDECAFFLRIFTHFNKKNPANQNKQPETVPESTRQFQGSVKAAISEDSFYLDINRNSRLTAPEQTGWRTA